MYFYQKIFYSMELTVKQYAEKRGINKGYISRIVRDRKLHLMSDVAKITKKTDAFGTMFYLLKMKPTKDLKVVTKDTKKKYV